MMAGLPPQCPPVTETRSIPAVERPLTRRELLRLAWPVILANAAVPLLGLADTAVIGNFGRLEDLGAIAFGAVIFSFVYWTFGFLRMSTTGFVAQAAGARDEAEVRATLWRALLLGASLGVGLLALQWPIGRVALWLLDGSAEVEAITASYFHLRIWGAPAALALFALMGVLIGLRRTRLLLFAQLFLNGLNVALDVLFVAGLGWGAEGVAIGTALAEWTTLLVVGAVVLRLLRERKRDDEPLIPIARVRDLARLKGLMSANVDIMLRTLTLVFSFAWFVRQSAIFGDDVLAATHILLQFISFAAFFLDGYAFVVEALVGESVGARDRRRFDVAVRRSTELAAGTAIGLALGVAVFGDFATALLTVHEPVRESASGAMLWCVLYVVTSFAAFQLDGIFIGATRTRAMRNAAFFSLVVFLTLAWLLVPRWGIDGLWLSFIGYVCARAVGLAYYYPSLRAAVR
jgi:multidrug resistance protein, MATE family